MRALPLILGLGIATGCTARVGIPNGAGDEGSVSSGGDVGPSAGDSAPATSVGSGPMPTTASTTGTSTTGTVTTVSETMTGMGFIIEPDGGSVLPECHLHDQVDCVDGYKCNPYDADGDGFMEASRCVPIVDDPQGLYEPCSYEDYPYSGYDDCDFGQFCFFLGEDGVGECLGLCSQPQGGGGNDYECEDPLAIPSIDCQSCFCICFQPCDPVLQSCDEGDGCYGANDSFRCYLDQSGDEGAYGDGCDSLNACDPGNQCVVAEAVPNCAAAGCCTEFCNVNDVDTCPDQGQGVSCQPWFPDGAPEGMEHIGVCTLPLP